jgi:hypothetical protein
MASGSVAPRAELLCTQPQIWQCLSSPAKAQLAASPYLLVDAGFGDESRWQGLGSHSVRDLRRELAAPVFEGEGANSFVRRVLMYAWHLARSHRQLARVVLGLTPQCAAHLSSLTLRDLDWVAEHQPGCVRPRWDRQPRVWRHLLLAAQENDSQLLTQVSLRGIQLLAASVLNDQRRLNPLPVTP